MSTNVTWNNVVYPVPTQGDKNWAPPLDRYLVALGTYALSPAGGIFTLTNDVNFGNNFGLLAKYFSTEGANPASAGHVRLSNTNTIRWRNFANTGDNTLGVDSSDFLTYNGVEIPVGLATLANGKIWIGSVSNLPVAQTLTGDVTVTNAGVTSIGAGIIVNSQISNSAAIAYSKLSLTGSITNSDIFSSAAIAYSKLNLTGSILNADINSSAAIAVSKLAALTASTPVRSDASGFLTTGAINLSTSDVTGNLGVTHLNSGTSASSSTFWRGDGTWSTPAGAGTVTSVAMTVPTFLSISGSPITTSGTLAVTLSGTALPVLNGGTGVTTSTGSGNNVLSTSPTLVTPVLGAASATSLSFSSTSELIGTTTNNNAAAGSVGEVITNSTLRSASTSISTNTPKTFATISLTAGDWDVYYSYGVKAGGATNYTTLVGAISTTTNALPSGDTQCVQDAAGQISLSWQTSLTPGSGNDINFTGPMSRVSISTTTSYFMVVNAIFTGSTSTAYGSIIARRSR